MQFTTYRGSVPVVPDVDSARLPEHLAARLRDVRAYGVQIEGTRIRFKGGIFRLVTNWNVLVPFGAGELTVEPARNEIRYALSFRQLVIGVTLPIAALVAVTMKETVRPPVAFLVFAWLWLVVGNVLIGIERFTRFLRDALQSAPRLQDNDRNPS
jgi:hypothetical protein